MNVTRHIRARTVDEAVELLRTRGDRARVYAGGTDILGAIKDRIHGDEGTILVDIKTIEELAGVRREAGGWTVGALTRLTDIERHPELAARFPC